MTDRPNHRAAAERMLDYADEWAAQAEEPMPEAGELSCLAHAAVHALLAIHDTLTAADRYAANEAKQRGEPEMSEAAEWLSLDEDDPLDEDDHRDRLDREGDVIRRKGHKRWAWPDYLGFDVYPGSPLAALNASDGPLTFAPEPPPDAAGDDLSASEGESEAEERGEAGDAQEALLCPECGHDLEDHCEYCCGCTRSPSGVAYALIAAAVKAERGGRRG